MLSAFVEPLENLPGKAFAVVYKDGEFFTCIRADGTLSFPQILTISQADKLVTSFNAAEERKYLETGISICRCK